MENHPWSGLIEAWFAETLDDPGLIPQRMDYWFSADKGRDTVLADRFSAVVEQCAQGRLHRDLLARFGRFPHRNKILNRVNTAEEAEYLDGDVPNFGQ
jgi:uncharacterized protein (DUF924 family)